MTSTSPYSISPGSSGQLHYSPSRGSLSAPFPAGQNTSPQTSAANGKPPTKNKPRKRVNTAEKRNQHNAIERQRRETLNSKFFSLARLLPALATHKRPSKSAIVNTSIAHLNHQRNQRLLAAKLLRQLCAERDALAKECNEWRFANGLAASAITSSSAWTDEMEEVCDVEKETFGAFANVDNVDEDGDDDDVGAEMSLEQAAAVAASFNVNMTAPGFITPRSSSEGLGLGSLGMQQWMQQGDGHGNAMFSQVHQTASMPAPSSMRSSTASLPFNAFMSDSDSPANSASGFSNAMPTPPTTGDYASHAQAGLGFAQGQGQGQLHHTPSPRSSHSQHGPVQVDENRGAPAQQWSEQQLLFIRAIQQQQRMQMSQNTAPVHQQQQQQQQQQPQAPFDPVLLANAFAHSNVGPSSSASDSADAFNFLTTMFPQHGVNGGNGNGGSMQMNGMSHGAHGNALRMSHGDAGMSAQAPPPLARAHTEHLEAWRRGTMPQPTAMELKNAFRAGVGIGMGWDQAPRSAVEGF